MQRPHLREKHPNFFLSAVTTAIALAAIGLGFAFGPDHMVSTPNLNMLRELVGLRLVGALFLLLAATLGFGLVWSWRAVRWAFVAAAAASMIVATSMFIAALRGEMDNIASPVLWMAFAVSNIAKAAEPPENPLTREQR